MDDLSVEELNKRRQLAIEAIDVAIYRMAQVDKFTLNQVALVLEAADVNLHVFAAAAVVRRLQRSIERQAGV